MLIPAAVEDLNGANTSFDHASGEQSAGGERAWCLDFGAVHLQGLFGFAGEIDQFGDAALHPPGHFILGDACECFGVPEAIDGSLVECGECIQHGAAAGGSDTLRIFDVEDRVTNAAESDAGVSGGQKSAAPHAREESLGGVY